MKIYSWNMLFSNRSLGAAFAFIRDADADLLFLQEVPADFVTQLHTLPYHLASVQETERHSRQKEQSRQELVILSRYPICEFHEIPLPRREDAFPYRSRVFARVMGYLAGWAIGSGKRNALFATVSTPNGLMALYNLHLSLTNPRWRQEEFSKALVARQPSVPTLVCGDFNIVESPRVSLLNWLLGGTVLDTLLWWRERDTMENHFIQYALTNPLRSKSTHPLSKSQLDHILLSHDFSVQSARVIPDRYGSDHHPIFAEVI